MKTAQQQIALKAARRGCHLITDQAGFSTSPMAF